MESGIGQRKPVVSMAGAATATADQLTSVSNAVYRCTQSACSIITADEPSDAGKSSSRVHCAVARPSDVKDL